MHSVALLVDVPGVLSADPRLHGPGGLDPGIGAPILAFQSLPELPERDLRIPEDARVDRPVFAYFFRFDVDLDDLDVGVEDGRAAVGDGPVQPRPEQDADVGLGEPRGEKASGQRVIVRNDAPCVAPGVKRHVRRFDKGLEFLPRVGPPDPASRDQHRAFRVQDEFSGFFDVAGIAPGTALRAVAARENHFVLAGLSVQDIHRDFEEHGPRPSARSVAKGHGDVFGDAFRPVSASRPFGQGSEDFQLVHVLHGSDVPPGDGTPAADQDDGGRTLLSHRDSGNSVDHAGSRRNEGDSGLAGGPGPAFGHIDGRLFVPGIDNPDAEIDARVKGVVDMPAGKSEDAFHAFLLQCPGDQLSAAPYVFLAHRHPPPELARPTEKMNVHSSI